MQQAQQKQKTKGRILRLKQGYNPNSSSLGSIVFSFPTAMLALPVVFSAAAAVITAACASKEDKEKREEDKS